MAYTPDIFSTQGGLTTTAIRDWIKKNDAATLEQWLASGNEHPRLAAEAIGAAVEFNRPVLAERIWNAGWHKPGAAFKEVWRGWRSALITHKHTRLPDAGKHKDTWAWLLDKHTGAQDKRTATLHNDQLLEGLVLSLHFNAPARWSDIMARGVDCTTEAAHRVFHYALTYTPWLPLDYENEQHPWVMAQAIPELLEAGFKPGGHCWAQAMTHPSAQPLFEHLMDRSGTLTTPRMRAAILVNADTTTQPIPARWSAVTQMFFELGVPEVIALSKKEAAGLKTAHARMDFVLEAPGYSAIGSKIAPAIEKQFTGDTLNVLEAVTPDSKEYFRTLFRTMALNQGLPAPSRSPKPRF